MDIRAWIGWNFKVKSSWIYYVKPMELLESSMKTKIVVEVLSYWGLFWADWTFVLNEMKVNVNDLFLFNIK